MRWRAECSVRFGDGLFPFEFLGAESGEAIGDFDAFVVLGEAAIVPFAVFLVMEDAQQGAEFGGLKVRNASAVEGTLHDGLDAGLIVRNRLAVQESKIIGHR